MSFQITEQHVAGLETPCLVIDVEQARRNIAEMQRQADSANVALRPHIKTHKMPLFARMQIAAGAAGITCAKVSEAEVMADGGIRDIFIAYPMVGNFRIRRVLALKKRIDRLILAVDSMTCAASLDEAAAAAGDILEVRLEIDTGARRTGVPVEKAVALARGVAALSNLRLTGIYTFKSLLYRGQPTTDIELAAQEESVLMETVAGLIEAAGIPLTDVSAGSSPTGLAVARTGKVTEIRPGTYVFGDVMLCRQQLATPDSVAARFYATVVSTAPDYAVIDGGTKTFPTDVPINVPPMHYPGYAVVVGRDDLRLERMYEEHGIITSTRGDTDLMVGEKIALIPLHICTSVNLQNAVYLFENDVLSVHKVDARGMLV